MRAVVDPNVLVSAVISPAGPPAAIVGAWTEDRFELVISVQLLDELSEVLSRDKFRRWIDADSAAEYVAALAEAATTLDDPPSAPKSSPDPDDDYLIALARAASADFLVSGDGDLTRLADPDPPVLTPREFLDRLDNADSS